MYLFPNLSILKAVGLSMISSAVTVGYIVHDNNSQKQVDKKQNGQDEHNDFDKQLMMGWWTQQ